MIKRKILKAGREKEHKKDKEDIRLLFRNNASQKIVEYPESTGDAGGGGSFGT